MRGRGPQPHLPRTPESCVTAPSKIAVSSNGNPMLFSVPKRTPEPPNANCIGSPFQCPFKIDTQYKDENDCGKKMPRCRCVAAVKRKRTYGEISSESGRNQSRPGGYACRPQPTYDRVPLFAPRCR